MTIVLGENRYGKSSVRLMKVTRGGPHDRVDEWNVEVWLEGDFKSCFEEGDNSRVLPTDTMKNTVYSLARASTSVSVEDFAKEVAHHFIKNNPYADVAGVRVQATSWQPITVGGKRFATAFTHGADVTSTTTVTYSRAGLLKVESGFSGLWLLKTAHSAFSGFLKDNLTTLRETRDRLFGTLATAEWQYAQSALVASNIDFVALRERAQDSLMSTFAAHDSLSVQQTLYAMAEATLQAMQEVDEVHLQMPNKHCNLVDLSAFGQDNPNMIFVPTDEPHGSISARIRREA
jgi:urate oxidase